MTTWTDPLTGSSVLPTSTGEILTTAIAYWEDQLMEWRNRRPRKPADRAEKLANVERAIERLNRYRSARDVYSHNVKRVNKLTVQLATDDLASVMHPAQRSAA